MQIVRCLINRNAKVDAKDVYGFTSLHLAIQGRHLEVTRCLLDGRANIDEKSREGCIPLHLAINKQYIDCLELLLDRGADIFAKDHNNDTSLHLATKIGNAEVVSMLLGRVADTSIRDNSGKTLFARTMFKGNKTSNEITRLFLKRTDNLDIDHENEMTALDLAIRNEDVDKFNLFLVYGATKSNHITRRASKVLKSFFLLRNSFENNFDKFNKLNTFADQFKGLGESDRFNKTGGWHRYEKPVKDALEIVADKLIEAIIDKVKKIENQKDSEDTRRRDAIKDVACEFLNDIGNKGYLLGSLISYHNGYRNNFKSKLVDAIQQKSTKIELSVSELQPLLDDQDELAEDAGTVAYCSEKDSLLGTNPPKSHGKKIFLARLRN